MKESADAIISEQSIRSSEQRQFWVQDIDTTIDDMLRAIPSNGLAIEVYHRQPLYNIKDAVYYSGTNIESSNITDIEPLFLGENIFDNSTPLEQTYYTSSFSQEISYTTSTSTEHGFKSATEVTAQTGIPFLVKGEIKETLEYNFSHTETTTKSVTNTITAPSQPVIVPANKIYKSQVYFQKNKTTGYVELFADILTGFASVDAGRVFPISEALKLTKDTYGLIQSPHSSLEVRAKGTGTFKVEYGTNMIVKTYDVTSNSRTDLLDENMLVDLKIIPLN